MTHQEHQKWNNIWHKHSLGLNDDLIQIWMSNVKVTATSQNSLALWKYYLWTLWGNHFKFGRNVHLDSQISLIDLSGISQGPGGLTQHVFRPLERDISCLPFLLESTFCGFLWILTWFYLESKMNRSKFSRMVKVTVTSYQSGKKFMLTETALDGGGLQPRPVIVPMFYFIIV